MSNYGTMIGRVLEDVARDDITSVASTAILTAIKHYEGTRFWFNEGRSTRSTASGTEYYAVPSDFKDLDSLTITVNSWTYQLNQRSYDELEDSYVSNTTYTGYPTDYAIYQEQIRLYPIPNGTYTLTMSYQRTLGTLSVSADTNAWMVEGEDLIRSRADFYVARNYLHDNQLAMMFRENESEALRRLLSETTIRLSTGKTRKRKI